ncbi:MAG: TM0996/MTH895 family glutaredoxin-like protein [Methylocystaceae bacterium]|nr:TM0996/MTH895 family glutaredoxin-like protein [Methylocystaceae bacterium]
MKNVKVLGSGCKKCQQTAQVIQDHAEKNGIEIEIEKVTDVAAIMGYGVMSTPGVVVDDVTVHAGSVPTEEQVKTFLARS